MMYDEDAEAEVALYESNLHRTLVEFLIQSRHPEVAAAILDGTVVIRFRGNNCLDTVYIQIPVSAYPLVAPNEEFKNILRRAMREVITGHHMSVEDVEIDFRMQLAGVPDSTWHDAMKAMIANYKGTNQGLISEIVAAKHGRPTNTWNELRYASATEVRIAQELERRKLLFFPLAVAVRAETGQAWKDHREVDFLVCHNGAWGVLEVSYHPDRFEKDAEKDVWFKKSGLLCIQHYTAERCYTDTAKVVDEFLSILKQYER